MCDYDDKIKICVDQYCSELTDRELDIDKAAWRFNCGKEGGEEPVEEETGGDCVNIFEKFADVFDESGRWKWYQDGWKQTWNVDLAELEGDLTSFTILKLRRYFYFAITSEF